MTLLTAATYVFLAMVPNDRGIEVPMQLGPYSTAELCRVAGEALTGDERFYTPAHKAEVEAGREQSRRIDAEDRAAALKKLTWKPGQKTQMMKVGLCGSEEVDREGKSTGISVWQGCTTIQMPQPRALTDCVLASDGAK